MGYDNSHHERHVVHRELSDESTADWPGESSASAVMPFAVGIKALAKGSQSCTERNLGLLEGYEVGRLHFGFLSWRGAGSVDREFGQ